jgi:hypothetical protein
MDTQKKSTNRVGRPARSTEAVRVNFHLEKSLYDWILATKGDQTTTEFINNIIRKEASK